MKELGGRESDPAEVFRFPVIEWTGPSATRPFPGPGENAATAAALRGIDATVW
jgi:hypothetical protein